MSGTGAHGLIGQLARFAAALETSRCASPPSPDPPVPLVASPPVPWDWSDSRPLALTCPPLPNACTLSTGAMPASMPASPKPRTIPLLMRTKFESLLLIPSPVPVGEQ